MNSLVVATVVFASGTVGIVVYKILQVEIRDWIHRRRAPKVSELLNDLEKAGPERMKEHMTPMFVYPPAPREIIQQTNFDIRTPDGIFSVIASLDNMGTLRQNIRRMR